jgi:hypothetical protein
LRADFGILEARAPRRAADKLTGTPDISHQQRDMYVSRSKRTFEIARFARRTFYIEAVIARAGFFGISLAARLSASLRPVNFGHAHTLCETAGQNIDMKKHIVRQNYFLTNSYHGGVSEVDLYRGFLLRCFCDMQRFDIEIWYVWMLDGVSVAVSLLFEIGAFSVAALLMGTLGRWRSRRIRWR